MTGESGFDEAERRIDELAEVTRLPISPSDCDHASMQLGARTWESKVQVKKYHRVSEAEVTIVQPRRHTNLKAS